MGLMKGNTNNGIEVVTHKGGMAGSTPASVFFPYFTFHFFFFYHLQLLVQENVNIFQAEDIHH